MIKVYVLTATEWDSTWVIGAYSTQEKAAAKVTGLEEEYRNDRSKFKRRYGYEIDEVSLDD